MWDNTRAGRIVDVYWYHPPFDYGWINETKVGDLTPTQRSLYDSAWGQAAIDGNLLRAGYGTAFQDTKYWRKGARLPVSLDIWWFAPKTGQGIPDIEPALQYRLLDNDIYFVIYDLTGAPTKPPRQSDKQKEEELEEIESGDEEAFALGVASLVGSQNCG